MAGCSIVMLTILLWPLALIVSIAMIAVMATVEFVTSPAFPVFVVALVCHGFAAFDVIRLLWRKYREREAFSLEPSLFKRPLILMLIGFALMAVTFVMVSWMINDWFQSVR